jgi:hypothetical protein
MTSCEKMRWFWVTGTLPGTMFDDLSDQKVKGLALPRRRGKWLRPSLPKKRGNISMQRR